MSSIGLFLLDKYRRKRTYPSFIIFILFFLILTRTQFIKNKTKTQGILSMQTKRCLTKRRFMKPRWRGRPLHTTGSKREQLAASLTSLALQATGRVHGPASLRTTRYHSPAAECTCAAMHRFGKLANTDGCLVLLHQHEGMGHHLRHCSLKDGTPAFPPF